VFGNLFSKKKPLQVLQQPLENVVVLGEMQGNGLIELRIELAVRLCVFPSVVNAKLPRLLYQGESTHRNCLVIAARTDLSERQREEIAAACAGIVPLDILFSDSLPNLILSRVEEQCKDLFIHDLPLFECPLVVRKGTNAEMPAEWPRAISFWYVAATDYEAALFAAVSSARAEGYEFEGVFENKVDQLDPKKWWSDHVLVKWKEYSAYLPSQERVDAVVRTGGLFRGPNLGPITANAA
jgi:hypothetical protein